MPLSPQRLTGGSIVLALAIAAWASAGPLAESAGENSQIKIRARLYTEPEAIRHLLGQSLPEGVVVLELEVQPKSHEPVQVWRDDFLLRSFKDGQASEPFTPEELASESVLRVYVAPGKGGGIMSEDRGPVWGGLGGGRPRRVGGEGGSIGNTPTEQKVETRVDQQDSQQKELLRILQQRLLPEGKLTGPVSGLLYFPLRGKHKPAQLQLDFRGTGGKLYLPFRRTGR